MGLTQKMTSKLIIITAVVLCAGIAFIAHEISQASPEPGKAFIPNDWFYLQRSWPQGSIDQSLYHQALEESQQLKARKRSNELPWEPAGATNIGGRITSLAVDPTRFDTFYIGTATGGVFKTTNGGQQWDPIFDNIPSLSIGAMVMEPGDPQTIYVGTGEANGGGGSVSYGGKGIYRTENGGTTWTHLGLERSFHIGRIVIDPQNTQNIFVAVVGELFGTNPERGVYRSQDGGNNWERVFFISEKTGCIDIVMDPQTPSTLYAAMWERERGPSFRDYGGEECGIWRSTDGGDTWTEMTQGVPNNRADVGRIGLAISASNPETLYAIYADNIGFIDGIYRSNDGGDNWFQTSQSHGQIYSSFGWWFGNIRVDPNDPDVAYALGLNVYRTTNGGNLWSFRSGSMHVDQHALFVHPQNSQWLLVGNDGGAYVSTNGGASYEKLPNLPITQFYTCEIDFQNPERLYGGTQDNGTNRTLTGAVDDWEFIYGGDGFYTLVDPTNNQFVYAESQFGGLGRSTDGGNTFTSARNGISSGDRNNWSSPLEMSPQNSEVLYFGTNRVYRSGNRAASWQVISDDLSNGAGAGNVVFGTVTSISASPLDDSLLYAGTDDGNVWQTSNGGGDWQLISQALPVRWVTRVVAAPDDVDKVYVTFSGFREGERLSHVYRSLDRGLNWESISGNLPEAPVNDLVVDPDFPNRIFVASDVGVFRIEVEGGAWEAVGTGLPPVAVTDLKFHQPTRSLVAGTYGRSMYRIQVKQTCFTDLDWEQALANWGDTTNIIDLLQIRSNFCDATQPKSL